MTTYGNEGRLLELIIHFSSLSIYDFNDSMPHFLSPRIRRSSHPSNTTLDLSLFVHKVTFISRRSQQHKLSVSLHHSARAFSRFQGGHWCCALYIGFFVCQEEGFSSGILLKLHCILYLRLLGERWSFTHAHTSSFLLLIPSLRAWRGW
jgi:hypothetical protein